MADSGQPVKAFLKPENDEPLDFLFNPAQLVINKNNNWSAPTKKGKNAPLLTFQEGLSGTLSFTAIFDTTKDGSDVTEHTDRILAMLRVDKSLKESDEQRNQGRPPWVEFHWGKLHPFRAVIERAQVTFTYFSPTGTALRAKVDLTLKQYQDEDHQPRQNPTSGTLRPQRTHHVRSGETLDRIAAVHYADPTRWRVLAEANGVDDPFRVSPGTDLVVPELEAVRRGR